MRPIIFVTAAFAALGVAPLTGCVTDEPKGGAPMTLVDGAGRAVGTVRAWQTAGGVTFRLDATGLPQVACASLYVMFHHLTSLLLYITFYLQIFPYIFLLH